MEISNTTIKKAKKLFKNNIVDSAVSLLKNNSLELIKAEFIYDYDNKKLKDCLLFIINRTK